jgi:hypothetical protein
MSESTVTGVFIVMGVVVFGGLIALGVRQRRKRQAAWEAVATAKGLFVNEGGFLSSPSVEGNVDGCHVCLDTYTESSGNNSSTTYTRIQVGHPGIPSGLSFKEEGVASSFKKFFGGQEHRVEDPVFDSLAYIQGDESVVMAVLDKDVRPLLSAFMAGTGSMGESARVEEREIKFQKTGVWTDADGIIDKMDEMIAIARRLDLSPSDIPKRLAINTWSDNLSAVRGKCFDILLSDYPEEALKTARLILEKGVHAELRLRAAMVLGDEGLDVLVDALGYPETDGVTRADVIGCMIPHLTRDDVRQAVIGRLQDGDPTVVAAALNALEGHDPALALAQIEHWDISDTIPELAVSVARVLGASSSPKAESTLIGLLDGPSASVQIAAATSLGRMGGLLAVEPLLPLTKGFLSDAALKNAAQMAVDNIQSRLKGTGGGSLTLAESGSDVGQLSLDDRAGALSEDVPAEE